VKNPVASLITNIKSRFLPTQGTTVSSIPLDFLMDSTQVTPDTAKAFSAVFAASTLIAESLATMPIHIFKRVGNKRERVNGKLQYLLSTEPNKKFSAVTFKEALVLRALLRGNGYAEIIRNGNGEIQSFVLLPTDQVEVLEANDFVVYKYNGRNIHQDNMLHLVGRMSENGITGMSVIAAAAADIGVALSAQKYGLDFFKKGSLLQGYITTDKSLSTTARQNNAKAWNENYSGGVGHHRTAFLDEGMEYKRIGIAPEEAQFIQTRKFSIEDIARFFNVPPHKIQHLEKSSFNNIEQQNLEFVIDCLRPWAVKLEKEIDRKCFKESQKGIYFSKINMDALLRGDTAARGQLYKDLFYIGALSPNDIRSMEDMNPRNGGDEYYTPVNMRTDEEINQKIKNDGKSK